MTSSIWLGLFAMLMIHVGPLYSALQLTQTSDLHEHHAAPASAHAHHGQPSVDQPAWLAALEMCGYCELLTLNPPLILSLQLILPRHQPVRVQVLPEAPLQPALRHGGSYPRAPPLAFHC